MATSGEASKYMRETLNEFARLCDDVCIILNNAGEEERELVKEFGFRFFEDNREWGKYQHKIKEDFVKNMLPRFNPSICIALDMDEVFDPEMTKNDVIDMSEKWHSMSFYFVQMWDEGWNPDIGFWSVRIWNFKEPLDFLNRPLQPGLVPKWALDTCSYAPHYVKHYGLKDKSVRMAKRERYEKYDPDEQYLPGWYHNLLSERKASPFDEEKFRDELQREVYSYGEQIKSMAKNRYVNERYYYVRNPNGQVVDIPEKHLEKTLKREGFELVTSEPVVVEDSTVPSTRPARETNSNNDTEESSPQVDESEKKEDNGGDDEDQNTCTICGFVAKSYFGFRAHYRKHK